ncbi:MAG: bacillithiol biosynthesis cysteine-adding enzyme BshC, partial [Bacteroidetes bacterium QH_6_63_17]
RPLMQDHLLPTAAYVAGPGEVSYFAQYGDVYDWAGLEMPLIHPRASVSLVEGKVQKVLDKYDRSVEAFGADLDALFQDVVVETMEVDVDAAFSETLPQIHQAINALKPEVEAVDRTLGASAEATRAALVDEMEALKQKVVRAEKRQQDEVRAQLEKARANLRPSGRLQERMINVLYYLNKYSLDLIDDLQDRLHTDTSEHQVVDL